VRIMSKLIEKLENVGEVSYTPLGFGAASRREKPTQMILIGATTLEQIQRDPALSQAPVHAFLMSANKKGASALKSLKESLAPLLWGLLSDGDDTLYPDVAEIKEMGCDFLVFGAKTTSAAVLQEEEMGKVLALEEALDENRARAIEDLPIDAVVQQAPEGLFPITIEALLQLQTTRGLLGKPFLLQVHHCPSSHELAALRDATINGLVVDLNEFKADQLKELRKTIDDLPPRKRQTGRTRALIPSVSQKPDEPDVTPGEEEEEEEDF